MVQSVTLAWRPFEHVPDINGGQPDGPRNVTRWGTCLAHPLMHIIAIYHIVEDTKPFIALVQGLVDSLSPSVISEMIAAADAASESGLLSDTDEEEAPLPDTGVFRYGSCCCVLQPGFGFIPPEAQYTLREIFKRRLCFVEGPDAGHSCIGRLLHPHCNIWSHGG